MDKETKIAVIISKLGTMINDWEVIEDKAIEKQAENLIIDTARKLVAVTDDKTTDDDEKPEHIENLKKIIEHEFKQLANELKIEIIRLNMIEPTQH